MLKKTMIIGMIFLVIGFFSLELFARQGEPYRPMGYGIRFAENNLFRVEMLLRHRHEIGLSDSQVDKIEKMRLAHHEATIKQLAEIKVLELKLDSLLKQKSVDRPEVQKMIRRIGDMKTDHFIKKMYFMLDIKDVLTAEQIAKIESLKSEMRMRRFKRRDHRPNRPALR